MSRVLANARSTAQIMLGATFAAVFLAACGTTTSAPPHVVGIPSFSISVPLTTVACTTSNSCIAVGTSSAPVGPVTAGQYRRPSGQWSPLLVPSAPSSSLTLASCWSTQCLFGGSSSSEDLLWRYDATTHTVALVAAPNGGADVHALSCYATLSCALVDAGVVGPPRFASTTNGGTSWTTPTPIALANHDTVTGIACTSELHCLVSGNTPAQRLQLFVTTDGGVSWTAISAPASWNALSSLDCHGAHCVALATTSLGSRLVRTSTFAVHWSGVALPETAVALACTKLSHCVIVGKNGSDVPWLAIVRNSSVTNATLQYVPNPLQSVACGVTVCATIGVTTVATVTP